MSVHERPFVERYLPALLAQAAHLMVGDFVDEIRSHGLSLLEWRVLATLADTPPLPVGLLARRAVTKQPTLTRLLDRLENQGLVRRQDASNDRRQTLVGIAPDGHAVIQGLMQRAELRQSRVQQTLGEDQWKSLVSLLHALIDQAGKLAPDAPLAGVGALPASRGLRPESVVFKPSAA